jgi:drug/metabolite transporter (DMT)-like permease
VVFSGFRSILVGNSGFVGLFAAGHVVSGYALQKVDATIFSILMATSTFWTMAGGMVILREGLTALQVLGVVLLTASIAFLFNSESRNTREKRLGLYFGLTTGLLFGVAIFAWVYVGKYNDVPTWNALSFLFPALIIALFRPRSLRQVPAVFHDTLAKFVPFLAVVYAVASMASLLGFAKGNVNVIAPLQQTSTIVTMILAVIFLRERDHLVRKGISALLCVAAVVLLL